MGRVGSPYRTRQTFGSTIGSPPMRPRPKPTGTTPPPPTTTRAGGQRPRFAKRVRHPAEWFAKLVCQTVSRIPFERGVEKWAYASMVVGLLGRRCGSDPGVSLANHRLITANHQFQNCKPSVSKLQTTVVQNCKPQWFKTANHRFQNCKPSFFWAW